MLCQSSPLIARHVVYGLFSAKCRSSTWTCLLNSRCRESYNRPMAGRRGAEAFDDMVRTLLSKGFWFDYGKHPCVSLLTSRHLCRSHILNRLTSASATEQQKLKVPSAARTMYASSSFKRFPTLPLTVEIPSRVRDWLTSPVSRTLLETRLLSAIHTDTSVGLARIALVVPVDDCKVLRPLLRNHFVNHSLIRKNQLVSESLEVSA